MKSNKSKRNILGLGRRNVLAAKANSGGMDMSSDILIPIPRDCISKDGDALPPIDQIFYFNLGIFCAKISILMIHFCNVSLKRLAQEKKNYPWQRPKECPNCKERLWGHGYVLRYFNSFPEGVFLRRWQYQFFKIGSKTSDNGNKMEMAVFRFEIIFEFVAEVCLDTEGRPD